MGSNIEKFGAPKFMEKRTLQEGITDFEDQKLEDEAEMNRQAEEIIDSFYAEGLKRGMITPDYDLSDKLDQYPKKCEM